ncbi:MAG: hypothetical protein OEL89_00685 [Candidatus Peregrinibacteria bacterium]|nr:hypothetical protein [Candidatus Peregrinibacteria bacterium]
MDIKDPRIASRIIQDFKGYENRKRRQDEYKAYKVSEGAQRQYIEQQVQALLPDSYKSMMISDVSIADKIYTKKAKAYDSEPTRKTGYPELDVFVDELYDGFSDSFQEFDRNFNRSRHALMWVNKVNNELRLISMKPFEYGLVKDVNTRELQAVIINYPDTSIIGTTGDGLDQVIMENQDDSSANSEIYAMWTKDSHTVWRVEQKDAGNGEFQSQLTYVPIDGNPNNINPLGVIPFAHLSESSSSDLPFLNPLTQKSIDLNVNFSMLLSASVKQGLGHLVFYLPEGVSITTVHSGLTTASVLPLTEGAQTQPRAEYINANPDLNGMKDAIMFYAKSIFDEEGLSTSSLDSSQIFSSGIERVIAEADCQAVISKNQQRYELLEQQIFQIIKAYLKADGVTLLDKVDNISIEFEKPKVMVSDKETLENIKMRLDMGLIGKKEALQMLDPNLTEEMAQMKLDELNSGNLDLIKAFNPKSEGVKQEIEGEKGE